MSPRLSTPSKNVPLKKSALRNSAPIFAALGDETRLRLIAVLCAGGAMSIAQLTSGTEITRQAVTKHLHVLADAGLVRDVKVGRERQWEFEPTQLEEARRSLDVIAQQWDHALNKLKMAVESEFKALPQISLLLTEQVRTMKVFVTRRIHELGVKIMENAGIDVTQWTEKRDLTQTELIEHCKQHNALLSAGANRIDARVLNECSHLKVIALLSVGFDNVDLAEATRLKIPIGNTPGVLSGATADNAFLLMLATSRKAFYHHKRIINGDWVFFDPMAELGIELKERTLGIYGLGRVGFEMAKRCVGAFNMRVVYCNRHPNEAAEKELNAKAVSFDELLAQSDVLSVHANLTSETRGKFDKSAFAKMKPNSIFVNAARGELHNEQDLTKALSNGTIWGAGLDVTNPEPMRPDNPLLSMPNVAVLPHIGSATVETRIAMTKLAAENIVAGLKNEWLPHVVNPEVYELQTSTLPVS
jgi:glyoxylate reductase